MRPRRLTSIALVALLAAGCSNAGSDRVLSITARGVVNGTVYFDANGTKAFEGIGSGDSARSGVIISLLVRGTSDTVAQTSSDASGGFRLANIPVGSYVAVVDQAILSDTFELLSAGSTNIGVTPDDSVSITVGMSYPHATVAAARTMARGRRVFVEGVTLNARATFSDTTVHLADTSGFIRMTKVRATLPAILAADSVRVVGRTNVRLGQPTLDEVTPVFLFTSTFLPGAATLVTSEASIAGAGVYDAALVQVLNATVSDTVRVGGDMKLTVSDGSGDLEVLLDKTADAGFLPATGPNPPPYVYVPGNKFDIVGVLVPTGVVGVWRLKPRSTTDLVQR